MTIKKQNLQESITWNFRVFQGNGVLKKYDKKFVRKAL